MHVGMRFDDPADAGRRLAARLEACRAEQPIVLGVPRGGVPVAHEVAKALVAPTPPNFVAVGQYSRSFRPVSDGEATPLLASANVRPDRRIRGRRFDEAGRAS